VANYNVDIEVGVKGTARLDKFTATVNQLAEKLDLIDKNFGQGIQNVARYERNIAKATDALRKARMGTQDETDAVKAYVRALGEANAARARQIALIAREQAASRTINPGATGFSRAQYGPAMPPAMVRQQQAIQGLAGTLNELTEISKQISVSNTNLRTSWGKAFEGLNETAKFFSVSHLNTQTSWLKTFEQLNETAKAISVSRTNTQTSWLKTFEQLNDTAKAISISRTNTQTSWLKTLEGLKETANAIKVSKNNVRSSWLQALDELESTATDIRRANRNRQRRARVERGRASQERMQSAVGSGLIGGAFPLLFGQGLAPAVGGGLGGFAGGLLGGQFGFGLGLVGTQLGAIFQQAQDVAAALGKAFRTGEQAAQALEDAVGSLNKETENYINNLEQSGQLGRQQEAILEVLEEKFGSQARAYLESAKSADRFKESTDGLFKSLQRLFIPATVEFNAITDGPLIEEPTPELTKAAERRLSLLKNQLDLEHLITGEKSLQGTKDFERLASVKRLVAQARFQIDLEKLQNDQQTGRISGDEYNIKLKIRQTQLGRELTEIERQRADAVKKSADEMERLVDEMVRGVNQAAAPGAGMAKALKEENQFLQNAVKFGVEAAEDIRQINRLTFSGAMSAQEAMNLVEQNRQLKEILKSRKELNRVSKTTDKDGNTLEQSLRKQLARYEEIDPFVRKRAVVEADHLVTLEKIAEVTDKTKRDVLETLAGKVRQARLDDIAAQKADKRLREQLNAANTRASFEMRLATAQAGLPGAFDGPFGGSQRTAFLGQQEIDLELQTRDLEIQDAVTRGLTEKAEKLKAARDEYELYEAQILEATVAQERFSEALALTQPVTDSLFDSLMAVADGTKSAQEAFADFLRSIASMLADTAKQMIAQYIAIGIARMFAGMSSSSPKTSDLDFSSAFSDQNFFTSSLPGGFTGKALGGQVGAGRPYMVGERGPELFIPGAQGNIVPNNAMGGANVTVNVDASGSSVKGDSDQAAQLGKMLGAAVQAELVKQKRPGGLLAS